MHPVWLRAGGVSGRASREIGRRLATRLILLGVALTVTIAIVAAPPVHRGLPRGLPLLLASHASSRPAFHPVANTRLTPAPEKPSQFRMAGTGASRTLTLDVSDIRIPRGVTVDIDGYESVTFNVEGDSVVEGNINYPGGRLYLNSESGNMRLIGSIDVSGANGTNGVPVGLLQNSGGNGGGGGAGGTVNGSGTAGAPGGGGGGGGSVLQGGLSGSDGGATQSSGNPTFIENSAWGCEVRAGGAAGGSNGTRGAGGIGPNSTFPFGIWYGGYYSPSPAIGTNSIGPTPPPAGAGSGGSGGCGWFVQGGGNFVSAGGGGGGGGGAGGMIAIRMGAGALTIDGSGLKANGGSGGSGGSGGPSRIQNNGITNGADGGGGGAGGAGGYIVLQGSSVTLGAPILANGGNGGLGGAGGTATGGAVANYPGRAGFVGPGGGGGRIALFSGAPVEGMSASNGTDASGSSGGAPTVFVATVSLTQTPAAYVPEYANDPIANCTRPEQGCTVSHTATITPASATGVIRFTLENVSTLKGVSTNSCAIPECSDNQDTGFDYEFQDSKQPAGVFNPAEQTRQSIRTSTARNSATVTVSSLDYGGTARLKVVATINGIDVPASVSYQGGYQPYAQIPIDNDDDKIADAWEAQFGGVNPLEDSEHPAADPTPYLGDGYVGHDEYRGFVVYNYANSTFSHVRTNPKSEKDVFFWDPDSIAAHALYDILAVDRSNMAGQFLKFRQVTGDVIGFSTAPGATSRTAGRHNRNSIQISVNAFPLVYTNSTSPITCPSSGQMTLGQISGDFANDGFPIAICLSNITNAAAQFSYPAVDLLAQVVAHEAGHKLSLTHWLRGTAFVSWVGASTPGALGNDQYTVDPGSPNRFFRKHEYWEWPIGSSTLISQEHPWTFSGALLGNSTTADPPSPPNPPNTGLVVVTPAQRPIGYALVRQAMSSPINTTQPLSSEAQRGYLMDYAPRFSVCDGSGCRARLLGDWEFFPGTQQEEFRKICIKEGGCQ